MKTTTDVGENSGSRFRSVDTVSDDIFDKMFGNAFVGEMSPAQNAVAKSRLQKVAEFILDAVPKINSSEVVAEHDEPFNFSIIIEGSEVGTCISGSGEVGMRKATGQLSLNPISFRAARTQSGLPEGIELITGQSQHHDTASTMAAIRAVMIEQKRELSRNSFPEIAASTDIEDGRSDGHRNSDNWACGGILKNLYRRIARPLAEENCLS